MRDRTCIIISHRLSTLAGMDRVVVLEEGRIVEDGTHEDLMRRGGLYANLHRLQFKDGAHDSAAPTAEGQSQSENAAESNGSLLRAVTSLLGRIWPGSSAR